MTQASLSQLVSLTTYPGQVALWWLGQASFALHVSEATVLVDPFLSAWPGRRFPAPFDARDAAGIDLVLVTHDHIDHLDRDALSGIAAASPEAQFVVPAPVAPMLTALGIVKERVVGAQPGESLVLGAVQVVPVPAMHGEHVSDAYSFGREQSEGQYRYLGYLIRMNGTTLYHAGDTVLFPGMVERLRPMAVDVALLPINGRSAEREAQDLVGNLGPEEAAELADRIDADLLIPMHYDMFAANLGSPARIVDVVVERYPDRAVLVPSRDRVVLYAPPR